MGDDRHVACFTRRSMPIGRPRVSDIHNATSRVAAAPDAPIIEKQHADSFEGTTLEETLSKLGVTELLVCGMMTHNCVTHTSISKAAERYGITVLPDCCTTVSEIMHLLALDALANRVKVIPSAEAM